MSQFSIAKPLPGEDSGPLPPEPTAPLWLQAGSCVLTCLLPSALVIMYWAGKLQCNAVVRLTLWSLFAGSLLVAGYMAGTAS